MEVKNIIKDELYYIIFFKDRSAHIQQRVVINASDNPIPESGEIILALLDKLETVKEYLK